MAIRPKYLVSMLANPEASLGEVAQALARYHAPSIRFTVVLRAIDSIYIYDKDEKTIQWAVGDGLTVLLHELGHHACRHRKISCCDSQELEEEAEAWMWAEKWAYKHNIKFNYKRADRAFSNYQEGRPNIVMNWKYGSEGDD